jgi:hypothetical protein
LNTLNKCEKKENSAFWILGSYFGNYKNLEIIKKEGLFSRLEVV